MRQPAVYIVTNQRNGTLYIGVTSDLAKRIWQHRNKSVDGFTSTYEVTMLVYFEMHESMEGAITREKQMKAWQRAWKLKLIEAQNPEWVDLWAQICGDAPGFQPSLE